MIPWEKLDTFFYIIDTCAENQEGETFQSDKDFI